MTPSDGPVSHRGVLLKAKKKRQKRSAFALGVERAMKRAAVSARKTARMHGTPIYVWEKGKVVAVKP